MRWSQLKYVLGVLYVLSPMPGLAAEPQVSVHSSLEKISLGDPAIFTVTFSHPGLQTQQHLMVFGDILGTAADRPGEISVQFEPDDVCEFFPESGKFSCDLGAPSRNGTTTMAITVKTQEAGILEVRGSYKLLSYGKMWSSETVHIK